MSISTRTTARSAKCSFTTRRNSISTITTSSCESALSTTRDGRVLITSSPSNFARRILRRPQRLMCARNWEDIKFRAPDLKAAAAVDVRPQLGGHDEVKFKEELLLERDRLGGMRSVYSHGCVLTSPKIELDRGVEDIARAFPTLKHIDIRPRTKMMLVNNVAVEEVQNTMGVIHFGLHFKG